jgi:hypothetical protein
MAHKVISIPGGGTGVSEGPRIQISGLNEGPLSIVVNYNARPVNEGSRLCGVLTFTKVMQYRWVAFGYGAHLGNEADFQFGLIEITDSDLIDGMGTVRPLHRHELVGLKHYRLGWNHYGALDILAKGLDVIEVGEDCP